MLCKDVMGNLKYNVKMKKMVLIGYPLGDDLPIGQVFGKVFEDYGFNGMYYSNELREKDFDAFMKAVPVMGICGIGVTMPYKQKIVPYLDDMEETARVAGASNNIAVDKNGKTYGYATDGFGMCQAIENNGVSIKGKRALVLGAGGASCLTAVELASRGISHITIANRTMEKARTIAKKIIDWSGITVDVIPFEKEALDNAAASTNIILNCTSLGMKAIGQDFEYLDFVGKMPKGSLVADAVIEPEPTNLLIKAKGHGFATVDGLPMFTCQVERICEKCFGLKIDESARKRAEKYMSDAVKGLL